MLFKLFLKKDIIYHRCYIFVLFIIYRPLYYLLIKLTFLFAKFGIILCVLEMQLLVNNNQSSK